MVFSKDKWNSEEGFRKFISASKALSFDTMLVPLSQAWQMFIVPLTGEALAARLTGLYALDMADRTKEEQVLLEKAQNALANLALYYSFEELNVRLTDQGHQRQETENFKGLYKYQKDDMRRSYKVKGFNALDSMLEYVDCRVDVFPEWKESSAYTRRQKMVVRSASEVNDVVFINNSYIVYLRMVPIINRIVDTVLPSKLGAKLFKAFMDGLGGNDVIGDTTTEELRYRVRKYVVMMAAAELVRETGSLTDRGLYFEYVTAGKDGNDVVAPSSMTERTHALSVYDRSVNDYGHALDSFIEMFIPGMFAGRASDVFKRDNDGKKTVWL